MVTGEHTALHPFSALPQQEPFFSCSELQQLLGHSHSLQGSSASDVSAQLHRRRVSSLFQNLWALFPCSYLVRFSSESHGSDQNILPTLSAFSLLDKCHVQSYLEHITLLFQYWLLLTALSLFVRVDSQTCRVVHPLSPQFRSWDQSPTPSWQGQGRADQTLLIPLWPWTGPFPLTLCRRPLPQSLCHQARPGQRAERIHSCPLSVNGSGNPAWEFQPPMLLFCHYQKIKIKIISFAHLSHLNGV